MFDSSCGDELSQSAGARSQQMLFLPESSLSFDEMNRTDTQPTGVGLLAATRGGPELHKAPTGIRGLDEITRGGLPKGRPTLVCGGPGSGKTLLALTVLVNGALQFDEPGVLMTFEENGDEIASDVASLGFDLPSLIEAGKLAVDFVRVERAQIEETGEYDLEGLFVRLDYAIRTVGAKRVVLDTIESLFSGLENGGILRSELRRLFR
jgi:circadian clock protein KaiC